MDPSVEFGLRFETQGEDDEDDVAAPAAPPDILPSPAAAAPKAIDDEAAEKDGKDAEIVSLDSFRK